MSPLAAPQTTSDLLASGPAWLLVGAYLASAVLCLRALRAGRLGARLATFMPADIDRRRAPRTGDNRRRVVFWTLLTAGLLLVGLDRRLGVIAWITDAVRQAAIDGGWYDRRRDLQLVLVLALGASGIGMLAVVAGRARHRLPRHAPALIGAAVIGLLLATRALSYHHVDGVLQRGIGPVSLAAMLEATAIAVVTICAWQRARWVGVRQAALRARA
jgi:hypothetical protein